MALTDENGMNTTMLVSPTGGYPMQNNGMGFGGDWAWIILLLLLGWGNNGFGGGYGGNQLGYDFPWLLNGQNGINANTNAGFQNAMLNDGITSVRDGINGLSTQLCNCCSDVQMSLANGFAGVEQGANTRQIANMQQAFANQTAMAQGFNQLGTQFADCCCENRLASADLKYTIATENCADRAALSDGIRDVIANQTASTQRILDQLCQDKIDAKNDEIAQLRSQLSFANLQASQIAQNQQVIDGIYNRLDTCPVGTTPVYGRTPIFSCNNGCGCGNNF